MFVQILTAVTAANGAPASATAGVPIHRGQTPLPTGAGFSFHNEDFGSHDGVIVVKNTAGTGAVSVTIKLWGYSSITGTWHPLGTGADTTKGTINGGAAMGATLTNTITHAESMSIWKHFERLYAEVTAIAGTGTAVSVWMLTGD